MKRLTYGLFCVVAVGLVASVSIAGTPTVTVYFDEALTMRSVDRLSPGQHTLYIVAEGFDADVMAMEYKIDYPAELLKSVSYACSLSCSCFEEQFSF